MKIMLALVLISILLFGCAGSQTINRENKTDNKMPRNADVVPNNGQAEKNEYGKEQIAGNTTPYVRYSEEFYNDARMENKVIYLYFRANWCPVCNSERSNIIQAFNEMVISNAVGFEVHFNDDETTDQDREAARKFGISYQHTTIILNRPGEAVYRSLSPISKDGIIAELSKIAEQ